MSWLQLGLLLAGLIVLFVAWDLLFCGGKRCQQLIDRLFE